MKKIAFALMAILLLTACSGGSTKLVINNPACQYNQLDPEVQTLLDDYIKPENITMKTKPQKGDTIATFKTNHGEVKMLLYTEEAPKTTQNFIDLAASGKYNDTIFHRVIDCFMVQGGDFENRNGTGGHSAKGPGTSIKDEFGSGLKHLRGSVSMANAGPNTGGSQFFIVQADNGTPWLDGKHAIFGYVYSGMDNVDEIAKVDVQASDKPVKDVVIESIEIGEY